MSRAPEAVAGADPVTEEELIGRLVERTTAALAEHVDAQGVLLDPATGLETPSDHYGALFAALALATRPEPDPRWRRLVDRWLGRPPEQRGHAPFNRLALLLLRDRLQRRGELSEDDRVRITRGLAACPLAARYPSNNWVLLAALCRLLEAEGGRPARAAAARFARLATRWFTQAGAFIDAPALPASRPVSTPLGYHAKALVVLRLAQLGAPQAVPEGLLERGLAFLLAMTDGRGQCGGFGRSSHALFGQACSLALCLEGLRSAADERARRGWALGARRLRLLLEVARRADGLLSLTANPTTGATGGWDEYMHLSVYNAWLAGLLGWWLSRARAADEPPLAAPDVSALGPVPEVLALDRRAGLLALRGPRGAGWVSLRGQPPQGYGPRAADLRWGGPLPFHLVLQGQAVVAPPALLPPARLAEEPALAGWTPLVQADGRLYALQRFEDVEVREDGPRVLVLARGPATAVCSEPPARGSPGWVLENVDHVLLGDRRRRRLGEKPDVLPDRLATVAFLVDALEGWCAAVLLLQGAAGAHERLLNPHGHALLAEGRALPLRAARWAFEDAPFPAAVGGLLDPGAAGARSAPLPASLPDARGGCAEPLAWPARDLLLVTVLGPAGATGRDALPLRVEPEERRLVTSWAAIPLR